MFDGFFRKKFIRYLTLIGICGQLVILNSLLFAEAVKDREGAVRKDKATHENDQRWNYNDLDKAFAESQRSGKPLLAVLRCVPCLACMGMDSAVLEEDSLKPLLDQFVCVRVINANSLDLSLFQFDFDLSLSVLIFNGDRTLYGRYGSWSHQKDPSEKSIQSLKLTLERALALHRNYAEKKPQLAGKQAPKSPYRTPIEIPGLSGKYERELNWNGAVVKSCVHCHQIGEALRTTIRDQGQVIPPELIYPMPAPETVGLIIDASDGRKIEAVSKDSAAFAAGFKKGDELTLLNGQSILSVADLSWALHLSGDNATLTAMVNRDGEEKHLTLSLSKGWRLKSDISRRVGTWGMRAMALGGLVLEDLPDDERAKQNIPLTGLALRVKYVGQYDKHAAGKKAGFQLDDLIISVEGKMERMSEGELIGHLLADKKPGDNVPVEILRKANRHQLNLPIQ